MQAPISFRLGHFMIRHRIRGGYRLLDLMRPRWKGRTADFKLSSSLDFRVPIDCPHYGGSAQSLREYEHALVASVCDAIRGFEHVTLFDCGADIGLFSAAMCTGSSNIDRVIAFEPNDEVQDVLLTNMSRLTRTEVHHVAVSDFCGFGQLMHPDYDPIDVHARYLVQAESGIPVVDIDSFGVFGGDVAIKVDVEGGELAVFRGASKTILSARASAVAFEANPDVIARTGVHPRECMKLLRDLAPFRFTIAETGESVDADSPDFMGSQILNIVGTTSAS